MNTWDKKLESGDKSFFFLHVFSPFNGSVLCFGIVGAFLELEKGFSITKPQGKTFCKTVLVV